MRDQLACLVVGARVDLPDQPVAVQHRQGVVPPAPFRLRLVHLQRVVEAQQIGHPLAVLQQYVERGEQRGAVGLGTLERRESVGVDPPPSTHAFDHDGFARLAGTDRLPLLIRSAGAGDAECTQTAAVALGLGFLTCVVRVWRDRPDASGKAISNEAPARAAFKYSILYLFVLFAALAVDHMVGPAG